MRTPFLIPALAPFLTGALCAAITTPAVAQEKVGPDRYAVTVHRAGLHPATPAAARRTLARIEAAALSVCGGSEVSFSALKLAIQRSSCWRDAVADTVKRIDDPLLLNAYHHRP
ncbi:MAG: UrcA family protein [Sphingomonas sp.]